MARKGKRELWINTILITGVHKGQAHLSVNEIPLGNVRVESDETILLIEPRILTIDGNQIHSIRIECSEDGRKALIINEANSPRPYHEFTITGHYTQKDRPTLAQSQMLIQVVPDKVLYY